jgi:hypothetical protein
MVTALSYYSLTPSGFEWEVGWNPIVVDEATWKPTTHQGISIWGHTPEGQTVIDKLHRFAVAARSLLQREDTARRSAHPVSPTTSGGGRIDDFGLYAAVSRAETMTRHDDASAHLARAARNYPRPRHSRC